MEAVVPQDPKLIVDPKTGNQYEIDYNQKLGEGGFGAVYVARQVRPSVKAELVVKISLEKQNSEKLRVEAHASKKALKHVAYVESDNKQYLFFERIPGMNLYHVINSEGFVRVSFASRVKLLRMLAHSLVNDIHAPRVARDGQYYAGQIHCDIKSGNAIVDVDFDSDNVKEARFLDFGSVFLVEDDKLLGKSVQLALGQEIESTPVYEAPEVASGEKLGPQSDIFSFGIIAQDVLTNCFSSDGELEIIIKNFISKMKDDRVRHRPDDKKILRFFHCLEAYSIADKNDDATAQINCIEELEYLVDKHNLLLKESHVPRLPEKMLEKFLYLCGIERRADELVSLAEAIEKNIYFYSVQEVIQFLRDCKSDNLINIKKRLIKSYDHEKLSPEDKLAFLLYLAEEDNREIYSGTRKKLGEGLIKNINKVKPEGRDVIYEKLGIEQKRQLLEAFNPKTQEENVWLFERMCKSYCEGTERFFSAVKAFIENIHRYPPELAERIGQALNKMNGTLFLSFLTAENSDKMVLYLYLPERNQNGARLSQLLSKIINEDQNKVAPRQALQFIYFIKGLALEAKPNTVGLDNLILSFSGKIKARLEKYERLVLREKSYFSPERCAVRRLLSVFNEKKSLSYRQRILEAILNGTDVKAAKMVNTILPNLPVKSKDGKRTYWVNFHETAAVVIDPVQQKPVRGKVFNVEEFSDDSIDPQKFFEKAERINEYFHRDVACDYVISDYVAGNDWSKYDKRVAPSTLPFVERLELLCAKLRNGAEGKPQLDDYKWPHREIHRLHDSRQGVHHLIPAILHYLGISDPFNTDSDVMQIKELKGIGLLEADQWLYKHTKIIGDFLYRMVNDNSLHRPGVKEIAEFFDLLKEIVENHKESNPDVGSEKLELLKVMSAPQALKDGDCPRFLSSRWWLFVEFSKEHNYDTDPGQWRKLAKIIADEKEKYTFEQRQFLRKKLEQYREKQFDKKNAQGAYQKIIEAAGSNLEEASHNLFPVGEEKEALIGLLEEIKIAKAWNIVEELQEPELPLPSKPCHELSHEEKEKFRGHTAVIVESRERFPVLKEELLALVRMAKHPENQGINFNNPLIRKMLLRLESPDANILRILSTPVENRAPGHHFAMYEYLQNEKNRADLQKVSLYEEIKKNAWNDNIAFHVFCNINIPERRKAMAKYIAENMYEYSGAQVVEFFNKLKEYKLDAPLSRDIRKPRRMAGVNPPALDENQAKIKEARDRIVQALKAYRRSLFYFNPKRLDISHVIRVLNDPSLQIKPGALIEPEYSHILDNILHCIPVDVLNTFQNSSKVSTSFNHYKLVKTPSGKIFAIDNTRKLGKGGYGKVYLAHLVDSVSGKFCKKFAVKAFYDNSSLEEIEDEFKALQKQYFETEPPLKTSKFSPTYLFMEYVPGKELSTLDGSGSVVTCQVDAVTKELPLVERFKAIAMLILEMSSAHQHRKSGNAFVHGDIKPNNVLVDIVKEDGVAKVKALRLLDFGKPRFIARFINPLKKYTYSKLGMYTPRFLAPESLEDQVVRLQSDLRALVPTILPLLGESRPFTSNDDVNRYFNIKGLLKYDEIPLEIRAAVFQYLTKMESWNPDERGNDDEAFHFFNAIYQYFRCTTQTEKDNWQNCEEYQTLINRDKDVIPKNLYRWFEHLHGIENPDIQTKTEMQRVAQIVYSQIEAMHDTGVRPDKKSTLASYFNHTSSGVISAEIKSLQFFTQKDVVTEDDKVRWEFLVRKLSARELCIENFVSFASILNKKREIDKANDLETVFYGEDNKNYDLDLKVLEKFVFLSKTKNHESNEACWCLLAGIIVRNIDKYNGAQLLIVLRKINKFNADGSYDKFRDSIKDELNKKWETAVQDANVSQERFTFERQAVTNLKDAIEGTCFFSGNNNRFLKRAISDSANRAVKEIVGKLGKGAAAA